MDNTNTEIITHNNGRGVIIDEWEKQSSRANASEEKDHNFFQIKSYNLENEIKFIFLIFLNSKKGIMKKLKSCALQLLEYDNIDPNIGNKEGIIPLIYEIRRKYIINYSSI
ncbi:hypothetical protein H8356DRAFT_1356806 [Neocallimastix lanati (nom. inval.)]|nr:hypothetical protein H8356DRAFT_1356806 [Neocallimastix sp. JGI-2020a]